MNFEEVLKSKGWTDADFADPAMKPVLDRLRPVVEETYGNYERTRQEFDAYKRDAEEVWTPAANARITAAEREAVEARRRAADYQEQLKIAKDYGLLPPEDPASPPPKPKLDENGFDPKAHKLVTYDDIQTLANREGDVIAMSHDLQSEYRSLTGGKELFEYKGADGKRGMQALLTEARRSGKNVDQYVAEKFNFNGLREQREKERQAAWEAKIRAETAEQTRAEMAAKYGNPMLRTPVPSAHPFMPEKPKGGTQPWEMTDAQKRNARIERALVNQSKQGTVN